MADTHKLHKKFINGLQVKYGLNQNSLKDYIENPERREKLEKPEVCVCGHKILNARYLEHRDGLKSNIDNIMIGNCCIKQFISKEQQGKHCSRCKAKHRNRLDNLCNKCRGLCATCDNPKLNNYTTSCYQCKKIYKDKEAVATDDFIIKEYDLEF